MVAIDIQLEAMETKTTLVVDMVAQDDHLVLLAHLVLEVPVVPEDLVEWATMMFISAQLVQEALPVPVVRMEVSDLIFLVV